MYEKIELITEQPTEQDYYFVIGKRETKACLFWNGEEFEKDSNIPHNKFTVENIIWLKLI